MLFSYGTSGTLCKIALSRRERVGALVRVVWQDQEIGEAQVPPPIRVRDAGNLLRQDDLTGPLLEDQRYLEPDQLMFATRGYMLRLQQAPSKTLWASTLSIFGWKIERA